MGLLSDEILHCETKACTTNSELSVRLRDSAMIKVFEVTKVPTSHLLILAQCHWAATCKSTGLCSGLLMMIKNRLFGYTSFSRHIVSKMTCCSLTKGTVPWSNLGSSVLFKGKMELRQLEAYAFNPAQLIYQTRNCIYTYHMWYQEASLLLTETVPLAQPGVKCSRTQ